MLSLKIFITGASGLLGSKIAELAVERGHDVYSSDISFEIKIGKPVSLDIIDRNLTINKIRNIKPEVIIHSAALTDVDLCEREKQLAEKVNIEGARNIVQAAKTTDAFLVYISTDYVFDGGKGMYTELDDPKPINFYGYTKLEAERIITASELESVIARPSVIYGSKPARGKVNFALWVLDKLKKNEQASILVDQYVSPTLNTNLAQMLLEICERRLKGLIHLSGSTRISRYDFAIKLAKVFDLNLDLIKPTYMSQMSWLAKRPMDSSLDVSKASNILKIKPQKIDQAIKTLKEEVENIARRNNCKTSEKIR